MKRMAMYSVPVFPPYGTVKFNVMNRDDMDAILKEVAFQQSGACDETSCIE